MDGARRRPSIPDQAAHAAALPIPAPVTESSSGSASADDPIVAHVSEPHSVYVAEAAVIPFPTRDPALVNEPARAQCRTWIVQGQRVLAAEAQAIETVSRRLTDSFAHAVHALLACRQQVIVTGMGKAGWIGQKLAATLASTGTRSHFVHPAEAVHGDLGRVHADDVVLMLSMSGETEELLRMQNALREVSATMIAMTRSKSSSLGRSATHVIELGDLVEACPLGLAPTSSTTAMLAVGDALALVVSQQKGFVAHDFARFHPGGSLGRKLTRVDEIMRRSENCRLARQDQSVREVFVAGRTTARRTGAVMIVNPAGKLVGIFTDSDLARILENQRDSALDQPVSHVMTKDPRCIPSGHLLPEALQLFSKHRISELPVVDANRQPVGLIDITDLVDLLPASLADSPAGDSPPEAATAYGHPANSARTNLPQAKQHRNAPATPTQTNQNRIDDVQNGANPIVLSFPRLND